MVRITPITLLLATLAALGGCATTGAGTESTDPASEEVPLERLLADAEESLRGGDLDAAQVGFALAVERDPENVEALYRLGVIHREKGSLDVAEGVLRRALRVRPRHQGSREALGIVLLERERLDEAEAMLFDALEGRPDSWQVMNALGVIHDMRGDHAEAQEMFAAALYASPRSAKISNNLGYSHYLAGDYDRAEQHIRDATRFDSEYRRAWSNLALVYARLGRYRDATAAFDRVVDRHQSANNLGYIGLLEDDPRLARAQFEKALRLSPSYYAVAKENLAALSDRNGASDADASARAPVGREIASRADPSSPPLLPPLLPPDGTTTIVPALAPATTAEVVTSDAARNASPPDSAAGTAGETIGGSGTPEAVAADAAAGRDRRASAAREASGKKARSPSLPLPATLAFLGFGVENEDDGDDVLREAIGRFQEAYGLEPDGVAGRRTRAKLEALALTQLQTKLIALGYEPGEPDGRLGRRTRRAIRAFEKDESLPSTGRPVAAVLERIELAIGRASRRLNADDRADYSARG